jgi:cyanate lyase
MLFVCLGVSIVAVLLSQRSAVVHTYKLATSHAPEPYTELYFENSSKLPLQVTAGKAYAYAAHVTNKEAKPMTYRLISTVSVNGVSIKKVVRIVHVADGKGATVRFSLVLPKTQETATVKVVIADAPQVITFRSKS